MLLFKIFIKILSNNLVHSKHLDLTHPSQHQPSTNHQSNKTTKQDKIKQLFDKFAEIVKKRCANCSPQKIIELLHKKYVIQEKYLEQKSLIDLERRTQQKGKVDRNKNKLKKNNASMIDLSNNIEEKLNHKNSGSSKIQTQQIIIVEEENYFQQEPASKEDYLYPTKTIQKQTGRAFYLLDDPFTPKIYKESLVQDYIDFRNKNFSDTMPVSRAQQRKSQNQQKSMQQKYTYTRDIHRDEDSKRFKKPARPHLQAEPLWKNRIKPDSTYMSSLAQVWTLQESCMSKKNELIKRFHEERQGAKMLIKFGYGLKTVGHKLEVFDNKKIYHKRVYAIVKQAFRCIEQELIEKYKKTITPLTLTIFRKVMCFLSHYHDSFKNEEEKKEIFSQYIRIAYLIETESPGFEESAQLYNFILKDVLPEEEYDDRIILID